VRVIAALQVHLSVIMGSECSRAVVKCGESATGILRNADVELVLGLVPSSDFTVVIPHHHSAKYPSQIFHILLRPCTTISLCQLAATEQF